MLKCSTHYQLPSIVWESCWDVVCCIKVPGMRASRRRLPYTCITHFDETDISPVLPLKNSCIAFRREVLAVMVAESVLLLEHFAMLVVMHWLAPVAGCEDCSHILSCSKGFSIEKISGVWLIEESCFVATAFCLDWTGSCVLCLAVGLREWIEEDARADLDPTIAPLDDWVTK